MSEEQLELTYPPRQSENSCPVCAGKLWVDEFKVFCERPACDYVDTISQ